MQDYVKNVISIFGNDLTKELTAEINRRLDINSDIGYVLYGAPFTDRAEALKKLGSSYVNEADGEFGDSSDICLKSDSSAPEKLENHLVWFYSKIDPNVVICNRYDHCNGDFIGVRYKFIEKRKIITFDEYQSTSETVVFESEIDKLQEDSDDDYITWQDLSERQFDMKKDVKERLITFHPDKASYVF